MKIRILHIASFMFSLGKGKGILGVTAYHRWSTEGSVQVFVVPNVNIFDGVVHVERNSLNQIGMQGVVWEMPSVLRRLCHDALSMSGLKYAPVKLLWYSYYSFASLINGCRAVKRFGPVGCIYAHTNWSVLPAFILSRLLRVPCIYRVYGIHNYETGIRGGSLSMILKPDLLVLKIPCDGFVISNDGTLGDKVCKRFKISKHRILFAYDGVLKEPSTLPSMNLLERTRLGSTSCVLFYAGRLVPWKRVDRLLKLLRAILDRGRTDVVLVIAGDGVERASLEAMARKLGVFDNTVFLGAIPSEDVSQYTRQATMYVSLQDLTNVSNSVLEAMALGTCVVVGNTGGTATLVEHLRNGVLVNPEDYQGTSEVVIYLLQHDTRRKAIGMRAQEYTELHVLSWQERMRQEFDWLKNSILSTQSSDCRPNMSEKISQTFIPGNENAVPHCDSISD